MTETVSMVVPIIINLTLIGIAVYFIRRAIKRRNQESRKELQDIKKQLEELKEKK